MACRHLPLTFVTVLLACCSTAAASSARSTKWFHSPTGNIECEVSDDAPAHAYCQTAKPARSATLSANGHTKVCKGTRCLGNGPENAFTLAYGKSVTVGPFRCKSLKSGMRCVVRKSGAGFKISAQGISRF